MSFWLQTGSKLTRDKKTPNQGMPDPNDRLWFSRRFFWFADSNLSYNEQVLSNHFIVISEKGSFHIPLAFR